MTISSVGIGSGLPVTSIVSQLVAIEKLPLQQLQTTAAKFQTQLSLYGTVKSQISALGDAAALLAGASGWNAQKATSSNAAAVGVTVGTTAASAALTVSVQQLAQAQSITSAGIAAGTAAGATGSLSIQLGSWAGAAFTAGATAAVAVTVGATDTVSTIASKINLANAGVTATVLSDGINERLVVRSASTGAAAGFSIAATGGNAALSTFDFTNSTATAPTAAGMFMV
jgi:flagellar hook-associated protein 2